MILTEHQKVYLHKVAHDNGFFFSGKYGFHQQAFFVFSVLNEMPWKWCSAARGSGSVLAFVCQGRRIVQLFPCLANHLAQGGCKALFIFIEDKGVDIVTPLVDAIAEGPQGVGISNIQTWQEGGVRQVRMIWRKYKRG